MSAFPSSTSESNLYPVPSEKAPRIFSLENPRMLKAFLNQTMVMIRLGSMVAYDGAIKFKRESILQHGFARFFKKSVSLEGLKLAEAEGSGNLYLADSGQKIRILNLQNSPVVVNGKNILAFENTIHWDIQFMKAKTIVAGGLSNVTLSGQGMVAVTSQYDPITLQVTPDHPVTTDPNATIAWSGSLTPKLKTAFSCRNLWGRGSGESLQLHFEGEGFVMIQASEGDGVEMQVAPSKKPPKIVVFLIFGLAVFVKVIVPIVLSLLTSV